MSIPAEKAHRYIDRIAEELFRKSMDRGRIPDDDLRALYACMGDVLSQALLGKRFVPVMGREEFIRILEEHPSTYGVIDEIFFGYFFITKRNQEICNLLKEHVQQSFDAVVRSEDSGEYFKGLTKRLVQEFGGTV
ncbi:MAG: hypothetical protein SA339_10675 [Methanomassiliicoccus sp.]|nr:hypothetical protein [Methanomassiliicoccus sp.]